MGSNHGYREAGRHVSNFPENYLTLWKDGRMEGGKNGRNVFLPFLPFLPLTKRVCAF
jgi:hypothetical protein